MPCEDCPGAEVWVEADSARQSPDPRRQAAGELARQMLDMAEPSQPILTGIAGEPKTMPVCCNPSLRFAETILTRTEHAIRKNDEAITAGQPNNLLS